MRFLSTYIFTSLAAVFLISFSGCGDSGDDEETDATVDTDTDIDTDTDTDTNSDTDTDTDTDSDSDTDTDTDTDTYTDADDLWVLVSHPDYQWAALPAAEVPWERITHLVLDFLEPAGSDGDYSLEVTGFGPQDLDSWTTEAQKYIEAAHETGVQVMCSLGGADMAGDVFNEATSSSANALALAEAIAQTLADIGFDGVELDWEQSFDAGGAALLLESLRTAWPNATITIAIGPAYGEDQEVIAQTLAAVEDDVDAFFVMSYIPGDQTWTWWVVPVPVTPLHGMPTPWGTTQAYSIDRELEVWGGAGVASSKVIMGVGGFGLVWADTNSDGLAPVAPYANYDDLENDPTCFAEPWTCGAGADGEVAPFECGDNWITQAWVDAACEEAGIYLALTEDVISGGTYFGAPAADELVAISNPCAEGSIDVGLILYETYESMRMKAYYADANDMRGFEFWTLWQMAAAGGSFPILEAVMP